MTDFVSFDAAMGCVADASRAVPELSGAELPLCFVRDLAGRIRLVVEQWPEAGTPSAGVLGRLGSELAARLGARAYPVEQMVVSTPDYAELTHDARQIDVDGVRLRFLDRQVTGLGWSALLEVEPAPSPPCRITFYSVKGGVGRTTSAAVVATHLAERGHRVLLIDLDLEAPGLDALVEPAAAADFGVVDWFVEDMVDQARAVEGRMATSLPLARDLAGDIWVAGAYGREPGDYLAKLGRVYQATPRSGARQLEPWPMRLKRMVEALEASYRPTVVLIDSRSGVHDLAAAAVTQLAATVLLFSGGSHSARAGYELIFRHWHRQGMAPMIRDRLKLVAALVPATDVLAYTDRVREQYWPLFTELLYDEVPFDADPADDYFSYDLFDESAPHTPLPVYWHPGLAAIPTLQDLEQSTVAAAYQPFLAGLDDLVPDLKEAP